MIRLLVANASAIEKMLIQALFAKEKDFSLVGWAKTGADALNLSIRLKPDLLIIDPKLPGLDSYAVVRQVTRHRRFPVLMLRREAVSKVELSRAVDSGVTEFLDLNSLFESQRNPAQRMKLFAMLRNLVRYQSHRSIEEEPKARVVAADSGRKIAGVVGLVGSTGGLNVLLEILKKIPQDFPLPILVVQHIRKDFLGYLLGSLREGLRLEVKVAEDRELMKAGTVYLAPPEKHLGVSPMGAIALREGDRIEGQRPSGTVLLKSIAENFGADGLGVVLTGIGRDGADGLKLLQEAGGMTLVQEPSTAVVNGMTQAAIDLQAAQSILPPTQLGHRISQWGKRLKRKRSL